MSWNPFKKKDSGEPLPPATPHPSLPEAVPPVAEDDDDDTQPIMAAGEINEQVSLIRENNGVRLERVEIWGADGLSDTFLRLLVTDPQYPATALSNGLLSIPEELTGFRDLLVRDGCFLAAAFDLPDSTLAALIAGDDGARLPRLADIHQILIETTEFIISHLFAGVVLTPDQLTLRYAGADLPEGLRRWEPVFTAWDAWPTEAAESADNAAAALARTFIPLVNRLGEKSRESGFSYGVNQAKVYRSYLEGIAGIPGLSYEDLASKLAAIRPSFTASGLTDNGQRRQHNEDAFLSFSIDQASSTGAQFDLAVVADGMGGHASGEVASSLALDLLRQQLMLGLLTPRSQPVPTAKLTEQLETIIPAIDRALTQRAEMDTAMGGMGTTLAGIAVLRQSTTMADQGNRVLGEETAAVFHVGDSRVYSLGPGGLKRLTRDHSFVQDLVDNGTITIDEAFSHPRKNVITRCLGGGQSDSTPDINRFTPGPGEILLIASDGLSDALRDSEIEQTALINGGLDLTATARALIDAANAAGGPDNITVLLVACGI